LTFSSSTGACVGVSSASCTTFASCANSYVAALNVAAAAPSTRSSLTSLKTQLATIATGTLYAGSTLETACKAAICTLTNATTNGCIYNPTTLASIYTTACANPFTTIITIVFNGFTCDPTKIAQYTAALIIDLNAALLSVLLGASVSISTATCGSLTATVLIPVASTNAGLNVALQNLAANPSLFASLAAAAGISASSLTVSSVLIISTPVPSFAGQTFQFSSTSRATWSVLSVMAAVLALTF